MKLDKTSCIFDRLYFNLVYSFDGHVLVNCPEGRVLSILCRAGRVCSCLLLSCFVFHLFQFQLDLGLGACICC